MRARRVVFLVSSNLISPPGAIVSVSNPKVQLDAVHVSTQRVLTVHDEFGADTGGKQGGGGTALTAKHQLQHKQKRLRDIRSICHQHG